MMRGWEFLGKLIICFIIPHINMMLWNFQIRFGLVTNEWGSWWREKGLEKLQKLARVSEMVNWFIYHWWVMTIPVIVSFFHLNKKKTERWADFSLCSSPQQLHCIPFCSGDKKGLSVDKDWNQVPIDFCWYWFSCYPDWQWLVSSQPRAPPVSYLMGQYVNE